MAAAEFLAAEKTTEDLAVEERLDVSVYRNLRRLFWLKAQKQREATARVVSGKSNEAICFQVSKRIKLPTILDRTRVDRLVVFSLSTTIEGIVAKRVKQVIDMIYDTSRPAALDPLIVFNH
ncbi:hypothetical protein ACVW1C_001007 [Bradyrhizobium sp. USDA 4011]